MVWLTARAAQPINKSRAIGVSFIFAKEAEAQPPLHSAQTAAHWSSLILTAFFVPQIDREKRDEVRLAQTFHCLSGRWFAGDSDLVAGSDVAPRWWGRQLDHVGFSWRSRVLGIRTRLWPGISLTEKPK